MAILVILCHDPRACWQERSVNDPARDRTAVWDSSMSDGLGRALRAFQDGQGLRADARLSPGGPTETRLNRLLEQGRGLRVTAGPPGPAGAFDEERQAARERTPGALAGRVGPGMENHPDDVAVVGTALRQLGHIKPGAPALPMTGPVFGGLTRFQRATGLARDGVITPDGPTEQRLAGELAGSRSGASGSPMSLTTNSGRLPRTKSPDSPGSVGLPPFGTILPGPVLAPNSGLVSASDPELLGSPAGGGLPQGGAGDDLLALPPDFSGVFSGDDKGRSGFERADHGRAWRHTRWDNRCGRRRSSHEQGCRLGLRAAVVKSSAKFQSNDRLSMRHF